MTEREQIQQEIDAQEKRREWVLSDDSVAQSTGWRVHPLGGLCRLSVHRRVASNVHP